MIFFIVLPAIFLFFLWKHPGQNSKSKTKTLILLFVSFLFCFSVSAANKPVSFTRNNDQYQIDNGLISITITSKGDVSNLVKDGQNLVANLSGVTPDPNKQRTFYLDYHTGKSGGATNFIPTEVKVIKKSSDMVHIAFFGSSSDYLYLEYHYIVKQGVSGVYSYVIAKNMKSADTQVAELRTVYRFDTKIMPKLHNGSFTTQVPLYAELEKMPPVQDETWQLPDGSTYSKYDLAAYMRSSALWGVLGNQYGVWVIPAAYDYYSGDDLKQELIVHQDGIALNYLTGSHLGSPDMFAPEGWSKFYGPWLVYVNKAQNEQDITKDAYRQADIERKQWPYSWVKDGNYPLIRGMLSGNVTSNFPVRVLLSSDTKSNFDQQTLGYYYSCDTDKKGNYTIEKICPGIYQLSVYALSGAQTGTIYQEKITVGKGKQEKNIFLKKPDSRVLWQIGQANRLANEFRLADKPRNLKWQQEVPAQLEYVIGKSSESQDWYFTQCKPGIWSVNFQLNKILDSTLNIAIAAASSSGMKQPTSPKLEIKINGHLLKTLEYSNDKAIYREAMQSGRYHDEHIAVSSEWLKSGDNSLTLELLGGAFMYDTINLTQ
jgi:rhamnogalacturonan endolyase